MISERRQVWLPSVITSAPAASTRAASLGVIPTPSARFSPLTTQNEAPSSSRSPRQPFLDRPPARRADHVAYKEDLQRTESTAAGRTDSDTLLPASCV